MHLNHFFLRQLAQRLNAVLLGARLEECFSQERDELVLLFRLREGGEEWYLRAFLRAELTYLSFPTQYHRARANTASLFAEAYGMAVLGVHAVAYDRSFWVDLQNGYRLVFKMHGNRSNVALLQGEEAVGLFKSVLTKDRTLDPAALAQTPDLSREAFEAAGGDAYKLLPQIGPEVRTWLNEQGFAAMGMDARWALFRQTLTMLQAPTTYYLTRWQGKTQLLLFRAGEVEQTLTDPLEAAQAFARVASYRFYLEQAQREGAQTLARRREQTVLYLEKMRLRREELEQSRPPNELADLVMAQLHKFAGQPPGAAVVLEDFYTGGSTEVRLKDGQKPQDYAGQLYRKARNAGQELTRLREQEEARLEWLMRLDEAAAEIATMDDVRTIRRKLQEMGPTLTAKADEETLPYRPVFLRGWEIRIGKNAAANDEMLRRHSHKDDLWLHAKDVNGSHVLICRKPGQAFPKDIVEAAAGLAAYHSKKRTESLADVQVTERKNIRKVKGSPAGAVRVERERVVLVKPSSM